MAQNDSIERLTRAATAACTSIGSQLDLLEIGNEWNMDPQRYRPASYSAQDYVAEWNHKSVAVKAAVERACPDLDLGFIAPTFIVYPDYLDPAYTAEEIYSLGYDAKKLAREVGFHK
ncbi:hypothetical protein PHISP_05401 [Aspergillus sp. HF37]|nr:hypothetical protein PHISP_05401 [Aspergillus sp. HF37]